MGSDRPRLAERRCDVAVIGGSAAGLAAALQLGRQRRRVIVVDAGQPRNAPAAHVHGYLGHEGRSPGEFLAIARDEVRSYGGEVVLGVALDVSATAAGDFRVELTGGKAVLARRVLAATGIVDQLPAIEGVAEQWGQGVIHCPFCHGFEVRDRRIVQIVTQPLGLHQASLFFPLTRDHTLVLHNEAVTGDHPDLERFRAAGVAVVEGPALQIVIEDGQVVAVELADGTRLDADAVVVGTRFAPRDEPFRSLGLALVEHPSGVGRVVVADSRGATSVPGVYAAGNLVDPGQQLLHAAASGSWAGAMISADLAHEDVAVGRRSASEADWDDRYSGDRLWSGNPNGALVVEVAGLVPGRVLDVGAGEGGDAIWLAEHGWQVTANEISRKALDRVAAEAARRGMAITLQHADVTDHEPFGSATFDLVSAQYASIPRTPDHRGVRNLLAAVAPGGILLMVAHDLAPMRAPVDPSTHSRTFDADAYERIDDVVAVLADRSDWAIERHEQRPRPPGAATTHHVDDVVLVARRSI